MTDTQTIEAINRHLDAEPTDWTARLELADLYEEAGRDDEAQYQRWAARYKKAPHRLARDGDVDTGKQFWLWWGDNKYQQEASVGGIAYRLPGWAAGYQSRQAAETDLMRQEIKEEGVSG